MSSKRYCFPILLALMLPFFAVAHANAQTIEELQAENTELKARVRALEDYVFNIQPSLDKFNQQMRDTFEEFRKATQASLNNYAKEFQNHWAEKIRGIDNNVAVLDIVSKGYRQIDTSSGSFLISIKKIQSVFGGGGYRLTFNVGNPNFASYSGVNLDLKWGEKWDPEGLQPKEQWRQSLGGGRFSYGGKLKPGVWTEFNLDIPVETTKMLEHIECSMDVNSVELDLKTP